MNHDTLPLYHDSSHELSFLPGAVRWRHSTWCGGRHGGRALDVEVPSVISLHATGTTEEVHVDGLVDSGGVWTGRRGQFE